jgi:ubiquitin carboxyl-terminal hydrolase 25
LFLKKENISKNFSINFKSKNVVQFVNELRKLFALMLKSKRKSINPNPTLRCLKNCSKYDSELFNQEDVSEFATILVNLIEESFDILYKLQQQKELAEGTIIPILTDSISSMSLLSQSPVATPATTTTPIQKLNSNLINMRKNRKNPIVKLLNGDILINRKNSDEDITNNLIEIFREVNIQMLNARNLHAGLELEWGETSIDKLITINKTSNNKNVPPSPQPLNRSFYQQESWIVQLPSVLFICLNRYKFIKATQSSSKIIEPFEFYPQIYLDRYMQSNRDIVKAKRKELQSLNTDLNNLQDKLKSITNYIYHRDDKITKEPSSSSIEFPLDIVLKCVLKFSTTDYSNNDVFNLIVDPSQNQEQLTTVQTCLQSWIKQVETKISQLEMNINEIKLKIENIFDEDNLKKLKYNLHSVCIHEGNAMSGHFWTYIWNKEQQKWFKFNDTEVSESNWDDLYENAVGGNLLLNETHTPKTDKMPSAYFLIYVKDDESNLYQENIQLDNDLIKLINDDQETLQNQLQNLKLKQLLRELLEKLRKSNFLINESLEKVSINNNNSNKTVSQSLEQNNQTCNEHAKAFNESTYEAITASFDKQVQPLTNLVTLEEALKYVSFS